MAVLPLGCDELDVWVINTYCAVEDFYAMDPPSWSPPPSALLAAFGIAKPTPAEEIVLGLF